MDPTHHDIIVDKLLQYWGKMPNPWHCKTQACRKSLVITQTRIMDLVKAIENLSNDLKVEDFS